MSVAKVARSAREGDLHWRLRFRGFRLGGVLGRCCTVTFWVRRVGSEDDFEYLFTRRYDGTHCCKKYMMVFRSTHNGVTRNIAELDEVWVVKDSTLAITPGCTVPELINSNNWSKYLSNGSFRCFPANQTLLLTP